MVKIGVYHNGETDFRHARAEVKNLKRVASITLPGSSRDNEALAGMAFEKTNHIDRPWWENQSVNCYEKSRSTSVGDVIVIARCDAAGIRIGAYIVAPVGFDFSEALTERFYQTLFMCF